MTCTFIGETASSMGGRIGGHWQELKEGKSLSVLYQHTLLEHRGLINSIDIKVLSIHSSDRNLRQIIRGYTRSIRHSEPQ